MATMPPEANVKSNIDREGSWSSPKLAIQLLANSIRTERMFGFSYCGFSPLT
jgi:hypothetical protein